MDETISQRVSRGVWCGTLDSVALHGVCLLQHSLQRLLPVLALEVQGGSGGGAVRRQ